MGRSLAVRIDGGGTAGNPDDNSRLDFNQLDRFSSSSAAAGLSRKRAAINVSASSDSSWAAHEAGLFLHPHISRTCSRPLEFFHGCFFQCFFLWTWFSAYSKFTDFHKNLLQKVVTILFKITVTVGFRQNRIYVINWFSPVGDTLKCWLFASTL